MVLSRLRQRRSIASKSTSPALSSTDNVFQRNYWRRCFAYLIANALGLLSPVMILVLVTSTLAKQERCHRDVS